MADLTPIPTAQRASDADYKPIAGYAIAAMIATGLFVILLVAVLGWSLYDRRPTLAFEILAFAVAGWMLAIVARRQINRSEGTRTGLKIASAAWWTSVLGGGAFAAYITANVFVLESASAKFTNSFLEELKADKVNVAFLRSIDPTARDSAPSPGNDEAFEAEFGPKGLVYFRSHEAIRMFKRNTKDVSWEHVGSRDLTQEGGNFNITQIYRVTCPEGIFEMRIALASKEIRKGLAPQWQIVVAKTVAISLKTEKLSRYGQMVMETEQEGEFVAKIWMDTFSGGRTTQAHLLTLTAAQRKPFEHGMRWMTLFGGGTSLNYPLTNNFLPAERQIKDKTGNELSFEDLYATGFFQQDEAKSPFPPDKLADLKRYWLKPRLTVTNRERPVGDGQSPFEITRIVVTPTEVTVIVPCEFYLNSQVTFAKGYIGVTSDSQEFINAMNEARTQGVNTKTDYSAVLTKSPDRAWRVSFFRTDLNKLSVMGGNMPAPPPANPLPGL